jgi:dihydrodipicolinate synthase/N-acetylneuraminate lyase
MQTKLDRKELASRLYVAMVNPYKGGSFDLDEQCLRSLVRYFLASAADVNLGLVVNPEAGEIFYMTREEKRRSLEIVLEEAKGAVPVVAGVMDVTTAGTIDVARDARAMGVDGIFLMPPIGAIDITTSWNPSRYPEVWTDQIKEIDANCGLPIFTHPVGAPSITYGIGLPEDITVDICKSIPNVVGWKMTYNWDGWKRVGRALKRLDPAVAVLGAPAHYFHEAIASDLFDGTISGSFNYALEPMLKHIKALQRGDTDTALRIWNGGLANLQEWMYSDYSRLHIRYKTATWLRGLIPHPYMRPPMPRPLPDEIEALVQLMKGAGLEIIDADKIKALGDRPHVAALREAAE